MIKVVNWVIAFALFAVGMILLIAQPDEEAPLRKFFIEMVATKVGAIACYVAFFMWIKRMERKGYFSVEEE